MIFYNRCKSNVWSWTKWYHLRMYMYHQGCDTERGRSEIMGMEGSKPVPRDSPTHSAASQRLIIAMFFLIKHSQFPLFIITKENLPEHILIRINSSNPKRSRSQSNTRSSRPSTIMRIEATLQDIKMQDISQCRRYESNRTSQVQGWEVCHHEGTLGSSYAVMHYKERFYSCLWHCPVLRVAICE